MSNLDDAPATASPDRGATGATAAASSHPDAPVEIELRLAFDPADAVPLRRALDALGGVRRRTRLLVTAYFDTVDRALAARRAVLRVRSDGRSRIQTLKAGDTGDALRRAEWETPIAGDLPEPERFADPHARLLLDALQGPPVPVFETRIRREIRRLRLPDAEIEIAIDQGTIEAAGRAEPVHEIELELRTGQRAALYELGQWLAAEVPLRLQPAAKSDRAWWLATGMPPGAVADTAAAFPPEATVDAAFSLVLRQCLAQCAGNVPAAMAGEAAGVHQLRVGLRRLRSVLWLVGRIAPCPEIRGFRAEAGWLAAQAGPARDLDVLLGTTLPAIAAALPDADLAPLRRAAETARARAHAALRAALDHPRHLSLHLAIGAWVERHGWRLTASTEAQAMLERPVVALAPEMLTPARRRVLKAGRGLEHLDANGRHAVRIRLKRLRYLVGIFRPLYGGRKARRFGRMLSRLQDDFGHLNDAATTRRLISALLEGRADAALHRAAGIVEGFIARDLLAREPALLADWRRFVETKGFWR